MWYDAILIFVLFIFDVNIVCIIILLYKYDK